MCKTEGKDSPHALACNCDRQLWFRSAIVAVSRKNLITQSFGTLLMKRIIKCTLVLLSTHILIGQSALSQELARNETVADRARPELDASGIPLGGFRFFPQLGLTVGHNDNIFADGLSPVSDVIYVASPEVRLQSGWSNHALDLGIAADVLDFVDFENEDHTNFRAWLDGRIDINRSSFLRTEAEHAVRHEGRDSADDVRGLERTKFEVDSLAVSYHLRPGLRKLNARFEGEYFKFDYKDVLGPEGPINNDDRDRDRIRGTMRLGFDALPNNSLFFQLAAQSDKYDFQFDDAGFERSSNGYEIAVGTALDYSGVTFGEIFVGYLSHAYDDPRYGDIDDVSFGAEIAWNISGLTTITLGGSRTVEPTTLVPASGVLSTRFRIGADHELLRSLILSLSWSNVNDDFRGIDRVDKVDSVEFIARYLMNRYVQLAFGFDHTNRDTTPDALDGFSFSRNIFSLTVEVHL